MPQPKIDLSPKVSDEVRKTTCYMCACRCGINVHMKAGQVAYIEGNRDHPVNRGVLCGKGAAGIMQVTSPSRLRAPLRRTGPRGSGEFEEITWDEALETAVSWMKPLRETDPSRFAFFTGRDQSQSFTGYWAQAFGTPNFAAHGGFCSVNMAAAGIYTMGGAFWEFGEPDWDRTKLFLLFGVAEDHSSNPIKIGIGKIKARGARVIGINPVRTGYNAVADDWYGITPGTDGLFILSLVHCLLKSGKIDLDYLARFTNAPCLVNADEASPDFGLLLKDDDGKAIVWDSNEKRPRCYDKPGVAPDLRATWTEGGVTHKPVFHLIAERYLDAKYAPEAVAETVGIPADRIRGLAAELAHVAFEEAIEINRPWTDFRGERHAAMIGRPVSMHAMRGISAHANGFQTARALHLLQSILGAVETPGSFRFKPPYPKPVEAHPRPHADARPGEPLAGPHLGYPLGPEHLCLNDDGSPRRIDKAYSWEHPLSAHGLMHMVIPNAVAGDPYTIDTLMLYMANMAWNSSMNTARTMEMLTAKGDDGEYKIPHIIYSDAYASETVAYADLVLPDTTYLERHDCISLLDRPISDAERAADAIRWPVIAPDRDVRPFQSVLCDLGHRLGLPGFVKEDGSAKYSDYADYITHHERRPGVGPLAGWRLAPEGSGTDGSDSTERAPGASAVTDGRGSSNPEQIDRYIAAGGFWTSEIPHDAEYYKPWNAAYQDWSVRIGLTDKPAPYIFQLYSEPLRRFQAAAEGTGDLQPPDHLRDRIREKLDPLPVWYPTETPADRDFPIRALTQRPMAMYHSWGTQNAWLRQIHGRNPLYVPTRLWREHGFEDGDWARLSSPVGAIVVPAQHMAALNGNTVWTWNAIGKRKGAWALDADAPEATKGFLLNHLIGELLPERSDGMRWSNSDPVTGQAAWFDLRVRLERVPAAEAPTATLPETGSMASPVPPAPRNVTRKVGA